MYKLLSVPLALGLLATLTGMQSAQLPMGFTIDAKVVSVSGDQLVVEDEDGDEHTFRVMLNFTKIVLDGKEVKVAEFKKGTPVRLSTQRYGQTMELTRIEGRTNGFAK
jgi:hypothetical protein